MKINLKKFAQGIILGILILGVLIGFRKSNSRIEIQAKPGGVYSCKRWSGGNFDKDAPGWFNPEDPSDRTIKKIHYKGEVDLGWQTIFWCDYSKMEAKGRLKCEEQDEDAFIRPPDHKAIYTTDGSYTPNLWELIEPSHYQGKCQIIQVDINPCDPNEGWHGGTAYVVYANAECPTLGCQSLKAYDENWQEITDFSTINVGDTVYFLVKGYCSLSQGITKARFRINEGEWQDHHGQHGEGFYLKYTIPEPGNYKIEAMVYNPDLNEWR